MQKLRQSLLPLCFIQLVKLGDQHKHGGDKDMLKVIDPSGHRHDIVRGMDTIFTVVYGIWKYRINTNPKRICAFGKSWLWEARSQRASIGIDKLYQVSHENTLDSNTYLTVIDNFLANIVDDRSDHFASFLFDFRHSFALT